VPLDALDDAGQPAPAGFLDRAIAGVVPERARAEAAPPAGAGVTAGWPPRRLRPRDPGVAGGPGRTSAGSTRSSWPKDAGTGVHGVVDVRGVGWGSSLEVRVDGVRGGERCAS
jgi:hypothetical protein